MNRSGKISNRIMVRAFCKKHRICVSCFRRWTERDTTRCGKCNRAHAKSQKVRERRNYERDVKATVCVRCHKRTPDGNEQTLPKVPRPPR